METAIHYEQFDIVHRLGSFGLRLDQLLEAVRASYLGWSGCTDLDPPMYPGLSMFACGVRQLRVGLLQLGWTKSDSGGYSLTISPDKAMAIGVATGDDATGLPNATPTTQSPKGLRTFEVLAANNHQLGFDFVFPDGYEPPDDEESAEYTTWLLLVHRAASEVRAELSQPMGVDDQNRVCLWRERIILPTVEIEPTEDSATQPGPDGGIDFDVPVTRRA